MGEAFRVFLESTAGTITAGGIIASFAAWTSYKLSKIFRYAHELYVYIVGRNGDLGLIERNRFYEFKDSLTRFLDTNGWAEFDKSCDCVSSYPRFSQIIGVDKYDCLGRGWLQGIDEHQRQDVWDSWQAAIESQVPYETTVKTITGKRIKIRFFTCWGMKDSNKPIGSMAVITEV